MKMINTITYVFATLENAKPNAVQFLVLWMKTIPPSPTPNSFVQFSEAQTKPNHPTSKSVSQRELFVQSRLLPVQR